MACLAWLVTIEEGVGVAVMVGCVVLGWGVRGCGVREVLCVD